MRKIYITVLLAGALLVGYLVPDVFVSAASLSVEVLKAQVDSLILQVERLQSDLNTIQSQSVPGAVVIPVGIKVPIVDPISPYPFPVEPPPPTDPQSVKSLGSQLTPPLESTKFAIGDRVQAVDHLNVRSAPRGSSVAVISPGTKGIISGGPTQAGDYIWWMVTYDTKTTGWSVENWLAKADESIQFDGTTAPPVFSTDSFVSPTSVGLNDSNWWKIQAGDPDGGPISYVINWGDGKSDSYNLKSGASIAVYHIYSSTGNFRIMTTAFDESKASVVRYLNVEVLSDDQLQTSTKFKINDSVKTTDSLNVRTAPNGVWRATIGPGVAGQILGGPVWSIVGRWWWNVKYENNVSGWSAEDWLEGTTVGPNDGPFACGDVDKDGDIDTDDVNALAEYIFSGKPITDMNLVDVYRDGVPDVLDMNAIIDHVNRSGPVPTCKPVVYAPITVISPASGETWEAGKTYEFKWTGGDPNQQVWLTLQALDGTQSFPMGRHIANSFARHTWVIDPGFTPGTYKVAILAENETSNKTALSNWNSFSVIKPQYACGDLNGDGVINLNDIDTLTGYIFEGENMPVGEADLDANNEPNAVDLAILSSYLGGSGPMPACGKQRRVYQCGDLNLDGVVDVLDAKYIQNYLFSGATLSAGVTVDFNDDQTPDALDMSLLIDQVYRKGAMVTCLNSKSPTGLGPPDASILSIFRNFFRSL